MYAPCFILACLSVYGEGCRCRVAGGGVDFNRLSGGCRKFKCLRIDRGHIGGMLGYMRSTALCSFH